MTRRDFLKWFGGLATIGASTASYAVVVEPMMRLSFAHHLIPTAAWNGRRRLRIVAVADPHICEPFMGLDRVRAIVRRANALAPDLIVLLGDYVATHRFVTRRPSDAEIADALAGLSAPLGRFAVMGNHDWLEDPQAQQRRAGPIALHRAFEAAGVPVLENKAIRLAVDGAPFWLAGLADQWAYGPYDGAHDVPGAIAQINDDAPAILMAHEPDVFAETSDRFFLTLAGHTHGGQIRLAGWAPVVPSRYGSRYAYGHIVERGRHLVVSAGLGCSLAPIRLGSPPELTIVDVVGENGSPTA